MKKLVPFDDNVEVYGKAVYALIKAFPVGEDLRREILQSNGLDVSPDRWFSQKNWLRSIEQVAEKEGIEMLEKIGEMVPENAVFPPEIDSLKKALESIDVAYQINHRGGEIGFYKLLEFESNKRTAYMECRTPYPSLFDLGLLKSMVSKFLPKDSFLYNVELDTSKPSRPTGGKSCFYKISW